MNSHLDYRLDLKLRKQIFLNLCCFSTHQIENQELKPAAVAIVITACHHSTKRAAVLLTRRASTLRKHAGQYALPGGKLDVGETHVEAALRELEEELGLKLKPCHYIGELDDYPTRSRFSIRPLVFWCNHRYQLNPNENEVADVFTIPLHELDSSALPHFESGIDANRPILLAHFPTIKQTVYSPTASILYQFREVAMRGLATRVSHYDQPRFAWR